MTGEDLTQYRSKIAEIDDKIIDLLIARFELTDEVGRYKKENKIPVENKEVEYKILSEFLARMNTCPSKESIIRIYKEIFTESKDRQRNV